MPKYAGHNVALAKETVLTRRDQFLPRNMGGSYRLDMLLEVGPTQERIDVLLRGRYSKNAKYFLAILVQKLAVGNTNERTSGGVSVVEGSRKWLAAVDAQTGATLFSIHNRRMHGTPVQHLRISGMPDQEIRGLLGLAQLERRDPAEALTGAELEKALAEGYAERNRSRETAH